MIRKDFQPIRRLAFEILQHVKIQDASGQAHGFSDSTADAAACDLLEIIASDRPKEDHLVWNELVDFYQLGDV